MEQAWYQTPLFNTLVSFTLGLIGGQLMGWLERSRNRTLAAESLKLSFHGEVNAIRHALAGPARTAVTAWTHRARLKRYGLSYPRIIFQANASRLGDLRDSTLVGQIVNVYSLLDRLEEKGRRIEDGAYDPAIAFPEYVKLLLVCYELMVLLDMRLTQQTKHLMDARWKVTLSQADAEDRAFVREAIENLQAWSRQQGAEKEGGETPQHA